MQEWQSIIVYGDFCSGLVWGSMQDSNNSSQNRLLFKTDLNIISFWEDKLGELYPVSRTGGIYQLVEAGAFLLDLRTPAEWDDFHTPQATHISLSELLTG